jgi:hypothetical protein
MSRPGRDPPALTSPGTAATGPPRRSTLPNARGQARAPPAQPPDAGSHAFHARHQPRVTERSPMGRSFLYVTPAASAPPSPGGSPSVKTFLMRSAPAGPPASLIPAPVGRSQPTGRGTYSAHHPRNTRRPERATARPGCTTPPRLSRPVPRAPRRSRPTIPAHPARFTHRLR